MKRYIQILARLILWPFIYVNQVATLGYFVSVKGIIWWVFNPEPVKEEYEKQFPDERFPD